MLPAVLLGQYAYFTFQNETTFKMAKKNVNVKALHST